MSPNNLLRAATRRMSYANIVASLALFIALGGVSYAAAKLPAKSVGTAQLKSNAVTSAKLKNRSVTGRDIRGNTLTGKQIKESTLAAVPLALAANSAATAKTAEHAADSVNVVVPAAVSASNNDPAIARSQATEIPLAAHGPVSIYAKCFEDADDKRTHYETYARTDAEGSALLGYSTDDDLDGNPALNPSTPETERAISSSYVVDGTASYTYGTSATPIGPDGKGLLVDVMSLARQGTVPDPVKLLPADDSCAFIVGGQKIG